MSKPAQRAPIKKAGKLTVREFLWSKLRELKSVQISDLIANMTATEIKSYNIDPGKLRFYFEPWVKSGHLASNMEVNKSKGIHKVKTYTLVKDTGVNPPHVDKQGNPIPATANELMWRTMRILDGAFSYKELAAFASTDDIIVESSSAKKYVEQLYKAGYLIRVRAAKHTGGLAQYRMKPAAWTGNKPPMIKRMHVVFDQNTHQVVWPKDGDIESEY